MDPVVGFIIKNIPYLWFDKNILRWGIQGWNKERFSRIYLVHPDQSLWQGYLLQTMEKHSEYFRGSSSSIKSENYNDIRLNGSRINLDNALSHLYPSSLPLSILYTYLDLPFHKKDYTTFKVIQNYKHPILVKLNLNTLKTIFPPGIDYNLIKMTDIGLYSITHWHTTLHIVSEMEKFVGNDLKELTITDATAGVGGDTLCFSQRFNTVNAVELDPLHCTIVAHNLSAYKNRAKVNLFCANYVDVVGLYKPWSGTLLTQNVIYFDPPWGGPKYKTRNNVVLTLDNTPLSQIIWHILSNSLANYIFIKAPKNVILTYFPSHTCIKIRNFKLICIKSSIHQVKPHPSIVEQHEPSRHIVKIIDR